MNTIFVVNRYKHDPTENDVYIGRGSPLGNPYSHLDNSKYKVIKTETREEAIKKYESWLQNMIHIVKDPEVIGAINDIIKKSEAGPVYLTCFCKPKPCHGEVIARTVNNLMLKHIRAKL